MAEKTALSSKLLRLANRCGRFGSLLKRYAQSAIRAEREVEKYRDIILKLQEPLEREACGNRQPEDPSDCAECPVAGGLEVE